MDNLGLPTLCNQDLYSFWVSFSSIFWKWEIQNISNDQKKVKNKFTKNTGLSSMLIVLVIFNFDSVWSYGILVKMVKISIEFKKKSWCNEAKWLWFFWLAHKNSPEKIPPIKSPNFMLTSVIFIIKKVFSKGQSFPREGQVLKKKWILLEKGILKLHFP